MLHFLNRSTRVVLWAAFSVTTLAGPAVALQGIPCPYTAFVHYANPVKDMTVLDDPSTNGNPKAVLFITPNSSPGGALFDRNMHPTGVTYVNGRWAIVNLDGQPMSKTAFNVAVVPAACQYAFVHRVTSTNLGGGSISLNGASITPSAGGIIAPSLTDPNLNPPLRLLATPNLSPDGVPAPNSRYVHAVGWLNGLWGVGVRDDQAATFPGRMLPIGAAYNVAVLDDANSFLWPFVSAPDPVLGFGSSETWINHVLLNKEPKALVFITQLYRPPFPYVRHAGPDQLPQPPPTNPPRAGDWNDPPTGVEYDDRIGRWKIVNLGPLERPTPVRLSFYNVVRLGQ
jgi:hypothetical protein